WCRLPHRRPLQPPRWLRSHAVRAQGSSCASGVGCSVIRSHPPVKRPTRAARRIVIVRIAVAAEADVIDPTGNGIVMAAVANVDEIAVIAVIAANAVNAANVANAATVRIVTAASAAHVAAIVTVTGTGIATGTSLPPRRVQPQATPRQRLRRSPKVARSGRDRRTVHVVRVTRVVAAIASAHLR
ncbi:MAG: hypothetical protein RL580_590, partial [Pseudomonadota bacterium]